MQRIEILIFEGSDELDVVAPFEILASAGFAVDLVTIEESSNIIGAPRRSPGGDSPTARGRQPGSRRLTAKAPRPWSVDAVVNAV
jgi:putative intracellular protease/amidase